MHWILNIYKTKKNRLYFVKRGQTTKRTLYRKRKNKMFKKQFSLLEMNYLRCQN
jgi:hypothetical protein